MNAFHVVVHTSEVSESLCARLLKKSYIKGFVSYRHEADEQVNRTHYHALLVGYKGTRETLRNYIKEIYNVERGSFFTTNTYKPYGSTTEIPVDFGLITYMSKGSLKPEYVYGFSEEFINEYEDKWVEPKKEDEQKVKKSVVTQWDIMEEIVKEHFEILKNNALKNKQEVLVMEADKEILWSVMVKHLNINRIRTHEKELERIYVTMLRMIDGKDLKTIKCNIFNRLSI